MKKNIRIFSILVVLIIAAGLFAVQIKNKAVKPNKQTEPVLSSKPQAKQTELNTTTTNPITIPLEEINKIEQYAKEFNIPAELQQELINAVKKGTVDTGWANSEITEKELDDAGISLNKIARQKPDSKTENISAGYRVSGAVFENMLAACKPAKDDSQQTKELKHQALEMLKLSELAKGNQALPENIPESHSDDTEESPMLKLEIALLALKEGNDNKDLEKIKQAWAIINEALKENQEDKKDKEFVEIAESLLEEIKSYE